MLLDYFHTPIGILCADVQNDKLTQLSVVMEGRFYDRSENAVGFIKLQIALDSYFFGNSNAFAKIPIMMIGTDFEKRVWDALQRIPYGETRTYGE